MKTWNKGRNCALATDFGGALAGDKAWIFDCSADSVTLLTKTSKDVDPARALKRIVVPIADAEKVIKLTTGKPRNNFTGILVDQSEIDKLAAARLSTL